MEAKTLTTRKANEQFVLTTFLQYRQRRNMLVQSVATSSTHTQTPAGSTISGKLKCSIPLDMWFLYGYLGMGKIYQMLSN